MNSSDDGVVAWLSARLATHARARVCALLPGPASVLYDQCAATPRSATVFMSSVRIWISIGAPIGPNNTVCSDW